MLMLLTRAQPRGVDFRPPPLRFFADNAKTAARSAAALGIAVHSSFPFHTLSQNFGPGSCQVRSPALIT